MMKAPLILCLLVTLAGSVHVRAAAEEVERASGAAFKGYELYSWQHPDGAWRFSLLPGTNRLKTHQEIVAPKAVMTDVDTLKKRLAALAIGEQVFWMSSDPDAHAMPAPDLVADVQAHCQSLRIDLHVLQ